MLLCRASAGSMLSPGGEGKSSRKQHSPWVPTAQGEGRAQPCVVLLLWWVPVSVVLSRTRVPFPGNNNPGESKKQSSCLSWLQKRPLLDFHFIHLPLKSEKPKEGRVPRESSLSPPNPHVGVCNTKTKLCC